MPKVKDKISGAIFATQDDIDAYDEFCERHELDRSSSPDWQIKELGYSGESGLANDLIYLIQETRMLE